MSNLADKVAGLYPSRKADRRDPTCDRLGSGPALWGQEGPPSLYVLTCNPPRIKKAYENIPGTYPTCPHPQTIIGHPNLAACRIPETFTPSTW